MILTHREWVLRRLLCYAQMDGSPSHACLEEAWRAPIGALAEALVRALENQDPLLVDQTDPPAADPWLAIGVSEARTHGLRWVTLAAFLGRFRYYRQSYLDLVCETGFRPEEERRYLAIINWFFDQVEHACCAEWFEAAEYGIRSNGARGARRRNTRLARQHVIPEDGLVYRLPVVNRSMN